MDKVLTTGQVAHYCQVSQVTVLKWIREGLLEAYTIPSGYRRVPQSALVAFLQEHAMPIPPELAPPKPARILVIHRDPAAGDRIARLLAESANGQQCEVAQARAGLEAGLQVAAFRPDVIVLDVSAQDADSLDAWRKMRDSDATRHIRLLAITRTPQEAETLDADEYVLAPPDPAELGARVQALLQDESRIRRPRTQTPTESEHEQGN